MKKRLILFASVFLIMISIMVPTASAVNPKGILGRPTLKISGTTAYCVGKYSSGNCNDEIDIVVTLKQGTITIASWSASGKGTVIISETCTVTAKETYELTLAATVNGMKQPTVTVTATGK